MLLCFALGAVSGYVSEKYYFGNRTTRHADPAEVRKEFAQRLHLDSLQIAEVDSVFDVHRRKMDDIRKLFSADRDTLRGSIRKLLSANQNKLYDDYIKEMESRDTRRRDSDKQPSK